MDMITQLIAARRVSTPLVAIRTFDASSVIASVRAMLGDNLSSTPMMLWDCANGVTGITELGKAVLLETGQADMTGPLPNTLKLCQSLPEDCIVFLSNVQWFSDPDSIQGIWNLRDTFKSLGNMLILLMTPGAILPNELTHDVLVLDEPLPTNEQVSAIVSHTFTNARRANPDVPVPDADTLASATKALVGLPAFAVETSAALSLNHRTGVLDMASLWQRKRETISATRGLTMSDNPRQEYGGNEVLRQYVRELMAGQNAPTCIVLIDEYEKAFAGVGTDLSGVKTELASSHLSWTTDNDVDGLGLVGVTGTGKTAFAEWLRHEYGIPLIRFDIAGMQSGIIGSSGEYLRTAQHTVNALSQGRILMIGTSNGFENLSPEMQGRFTLGMFWVEIPDTAERQVIWAIYKAQYSLSASDPTPNDVGWTGREIRECCKKAHRLGISLVSASRYIIPVTRSNASKIHDMRVAASGRYLSASKPGEYIYVPTTTTVSQHAFPVQMDGRKIREMN